MSEDAGSTGCVRAGGFVRGQRPLSDTKCQYSRHSGNGEGIFWGVGELFEAESEGRCGPAQRQEWAFKRKQFGKPNYTAAPAPRFSTSFPLTPHARRLPEFFDGRDPRIEKCGAGASRHAADYGPPGLARPSCTRTLGDRKSASVSQAGNNGGDALVAARHLSRWLDVTVVFTGVESSFAGIESARPSGGCRRRVRNHSRRAAWHCLVDCRLGWRVRSGVTPNGELIMQRAAADRDRHSQRLHAIADGARSPYARTHLTFIGPQARPADAGRTTAGAVRLTLGLNIPEKSGPSAGHESAYWAQSCVRGQRNSNRDCETWESRGAGNGRAALWRAARRSAR